MAAKRSLAEIQEDQRRACEVDNAQAAAARKNQPHEIREGSLMKRQSKNLHQKDGKSS